jgi:hypothetical protein
VNASTAGNVRMHSPTSDEVRAAGEWLGQVEPAGASDLGASLRLAARAANQGTTDASREVHVIYVGDGVASVGHRAAGALAEEAEQIATRERVSITTVGIGGDADTVALGAIARAGGGHYVPFVPGERTSSTALAVLETTYGVSLEDATFELPEGLSDVAPTALPTIRAGEEVIVSARLDRPSVSGDVIVRGTVGGEAFEQRYPVTVEPSTSAGNLFVPAQWASSTIERLELEGRGEDEARIIALSKAYSVMSRHTSLLVLESESMFRAFGIDREAQQQAAWTGDEAAEGSISSRARSRPLARPSRPARRARSAGSRATGVAAAARAPATGLARAWVACARAARRRRWTATWPASTTRSRGPIARRKLLWPSLARPRASRWRVAPRRRRRPLRRRWPAVPRCPRCRCSRAARASGCVACGCAWATCRAPTRSRSASRRRRVWRSRTSRRCPTAEIVIASRCERSRAPAT